MNERPQNSQPPGFEEFQRQMQEFLRQNFRTGQPGGPPPPPSPSTSHASGATAEPKPASSEDFKFEYRPRDVKEHLDRFVIKQEEAKKVLSVALCDHYHHVQQALQGRGSHTYAKQNVLLLGPTGVGKTYLIRSIAELIGVPFVKADATKFSETGYVGGDAEDLVRDLLRQANNDVVRAQYGIIYIDEIDKITGSHTSHGRDVSGRGVQTNLLKLMEETEVPLRSPTDIQSQLQAAFEYQRRGKVKRETINTKHILFIVSGAFDQMLEIIRRRLRESAIGFGASIAEDYSEADLLRKSRTEDFIKFGFEPEFVGRLPVRVVLDKLSVDDLFNILKQSEGSVIKQYEASFRAFGIDVIFSDEGLHAIADLAAKENTGARGLLTVSERALREFKYELPSSTVRQFVVTRELVEHPEAELQRILRVPDYEKRQLMQQFVREFERKFEGKHSLRIRFADDAVEEIVDRALSANKSVTDLCTDLLKDYQFGLNLIKTNTGQTEFVIPKSALAAPDKFLSDWVVSSYRKE
jgi:ATP-dependent Clp protease ATP-binding subunit ClpX